MDSPGRASVSNSPSGNYGIDPSSETRPSRATERQVAGSTARMDASLCHGVDLAGSTGQAVVIQYERADGVIPARRFG
jgi:hypothetical protein